MFEWMQSWKALGRFVCTERFEAQLIERSSRRGVVADDAAIVGHYSSLIEAPDQ